MDHSNFLPCSSVNSHSNSRKPGSYYPLFIYLIVQFQCMCSSIRIVNLWPRRYSFYREFFLFVVLQILHVGQHLYPPSTLACLFHEFLIQLDSLVTFFPKWCFLKRYLHTLRFTLCAVKFYGFWLVNSIMYSAFQYHTE